MSAIIIFLDLPRSSSLYLYDESWIFQHNAAIPYTWATCRRDTYTRVVIL
jgi:hypothetical protein